MVYKYLVVIMSAADMGLCLFWAIKHVKIHYFVFVRIYDLHLTIFVCKKIICHKIFVFQNYEIYL